jgi:GMP synthase (glutamine-hydrolysing)
VRLASSAACPVQAFRVGQHVYATQFHPELDADGICTRIDVYKDHGYFAPEAADDLKSVARQHDVTHPMRILRNFAQQYARS